MRFLSLLMATTLGAATLASAQEAMPIKTLIGRAIAQGNSQGWVGGPVAQQYLNQMQRVAKRPSAAAGGTDSGLVLAQATRLTRYSDDCARLGLRFSRPGWVLTAQDGRTAPAVIGMEMNVCADGSPAPQGMNMQRLAPGAAPLRPTRPPVDLK
jgi:hypothetical protein